MLLPVQFAYPAGFCQPGPFPQGHPIQDPVFPVHKRLDNLYGFPMSIHFIEIASPFFFRHLRDELQVRIGTPTDTPKHLSLEGWQALVERISEKATGEMLTKIQRKLFINAERVECDTQGRFTIRTDFCEYANLQKAVTVFGAGQRIELWNPEAFAEIEADTDDLDDFDFSVIDY